MVNITRSTILSSYKIEWRFICMCGDKTEGNKIMILYKFGSVLIHYGISVIRGHWSDAITGLCDE